MTIEYSLGSDMLAYKCEMRLDNYSNEAYY